MNESLTIHFGKSIDTGYKSHLMLSKFATEVLNSNFSNINLDFSTIDFIASNQFAILGCILDTFNNKHPDAKVYMSSLKNKIREIIQKNGFNKHLNLEKIPDTYNTVIPYTIFGINQIDSFEKYILLRIFSRDDIPKMSEKLRSQMIDSILEIFNNVKEHTHSKKVYTCGQFFPRSSLLYLTIVDSGETIPYNVNTFFSSCNIDPPDQALNWALISGNTTRKGNTPGGLGLSLLDDFVQLNEGKLYIVSGNETYERTEKNSRYKYMEYTFPGTIVTVALNLSDTTNIYHMKSETLSEILF